MLRLERISVAYGKHEALHDVTVEIAPSRTTAILGANGAENRRGAAWRDIDVDVVQRLMFAVGDADAVRREHLELEEERVAVGGVGAAVHLEQSLHARVIETSLSDLHSHPPQSNLKCSAPCHRSRPS